MRTFCAGWYLLYTKPRHEKKVFTQLTDLKINSFLPTRKSLRVWRDRAKVVDEPLFPSYVFIYLEDMKGFYEGTNTDGVLYYVRNGKEIAKVQDSIIADIRLIAGQGKEIEITEQAFEPGRKYFIGKGPFSSLGCEVVQYKNKEMLLVRVDLLRRNVLVSLPAEYLLDLNS